MLLTTYLAIDIDMAIRNEQDITISGGCTLEISNKHLLSTPFRYFDERGSAASRDARCNACMLKIDYILLRARKFSPIVRNTNCMREREVREVTRVKSQRARQLAVRVVRRRD